MRLLDVLSDVITVASKKTQGHNTAELYAMKSIIPAHWLCISHPMYVYVHVLQFGCEQYHVYSRKNINETKQCFI